MLQLSLHGCMASVSAATAHVQINRLMDVLKKPYELQPGTEKYRVPAPKQPRIGVELLSCSS